MYAVSPDFLQDEAGIRQVWKAVAVIFFVMLLVAAGVTIERASEKRRQGPSGFGKVQESTYAITETSGQYTQPRAIVDTSDWQTQTLKLIGIEITVPQEWEQRGGGAFSRSVEFDVVSPIFGTKIFMVSLLSNPENYSLREFVWKAVLGKEGTLAEGVNSGAVELGGYWQIDGEEGFSLYHKEPGKEGDYIVLPWRSKMLVFYIEDLHFLPANKELYTVLSTVKLLD
jgi:hypothetical protein